MESSFIYDLPNAFVCLLTVILVQAWAKIPPSYVILLLLHSILPYFLNDFLFSSSYMPDQFRYFDGVHAIRSGKSPDDFGNVLHASWMLSFIPLPLVETIKSLGFFNKFLFIVLFGFLYKKNVLTPFSAAFYLLYPSFALYSGLSLRDTLITSSMILSVYFAIHHRVLMFIVSMTPLAFIKAQNLLMMLPLLLFMIFNLRVKGITITRTVLIALIGLVILTAFYPLVEPLLNHLRVSMAAEDGQNPDHVRLLSGIVDFLLTGLVSSFEFLIKPLLWQASGVLQYIQAIENIVITYLLYLLTKNSLSVSIRHTLFWVLLFFFSMLMYGLIISNFGTAARYRFPFIIVYVISLSYVIDLRVRSSVKASENP